MSFALGFLPIALLLAGFPIYLVLLSSSAVALVFFSNTPLNIIHQTMFGSIDAFALLAVPFFIYAGELMGRAALRSDWSTRFRRVWAMFAAALA